MRHQSHQIKSAQLQNTDLQGVTLASSRKYSQSLKRVQTKSNIHTLAGTVQQSLIQVYSSKYNKSFVSPAKNTKRPSSQSNPERSRSTVALKGLDMRASHIPNMSDVHHSNLDKHLTSHPEAKSVIVHCYL